MNNIILFEEKVTTYYLYTNILQKFLEIYSEGHVVPPILDMRNTTYIASSAVPVLLSFGDYLRKLYKQPIELLVDEESSVFNFIMCSKFKSIFEQLGIFKIKAGSEDLLGNWRYKQLRDLHKVSFTNIKYDDADKIKDEEQKRAYIYDCLLDKNKATYGSVLHDTNQLSESIIEATISSIAEVETNAIMYSKSYSFTYVASDRYGTNISIADSGIGFERSFKEKKRKMSMVTKYKQLDSSFHNYLVIMSVLDYSYKKHLSDGRKDLWTLRTNVIHNNGVFKIQCGNTQVIFSSGRCKKCEKMCKKEDISTCVECLLEAHNKEVYSPIKQFRVGLQGVRIEITVNREDS